jgi:hypothetical protein
MSDIRVTPKTAPRCPNHGCALEGCGFPLPPKGEGVCPVSKCSFSFSVDGSEEAMRPVKDTAGNITMQPTWKIIGEE